MSRPSLSHPSARSSCRTAAVLLGLPLAVLGASPALAARPALTHEQERVVLRLVDDACADTWCSGDVDLRFQRLRCGPDACTLRFAVASRAEGPRHWEPRSGALPGAWTYPRVVSTSPSGYRALTPAFFDAVGDVVRSAVPPAGRAQ